MTGYKAKLLIKQFSNPDPKNTLSAKLPFRPKENDGFHLTVTFDFAPDTDEVTDLEHSIKALIEKFAGNARLRRSQQLDRYVEQV